MEKKIEKIEGAYDLPVIKKKLNQVIDYLNSESRPEGNYKLTIEDLEDITKLIKEQNNDSVSIEYLMQYCGYLNTQPQAEEGVNEYFFDTYEKAGEEIKKNKQSILEQKEEWEERFAEFFLYVTNDKNWVDGRPEWKGDVFVTLYNAILHFIENLLDERETKAFNEGVKEMEDSEQIQADWDIEELGNIVDKIVKKLDKLTTK